MSTSPRAVSGRAGCLCHIMLIRDGHGSKNGGRSSATNPHILTHNGSYPVGICRAIYIHIYIYPFCGR